MTGKGTELYKRKNAPYKLLKRSVYFLEKHKNAAVYTIDGGGY